MAWRIGIDSGGTFTDVCLFEETSGRVEIWKVPSTPQDPSGGIALGLQEGLRLVGGEGSDVSFLGHGTTVATNALIELRGSKTGLIVTGGFRDLLEIGRQRRPSLYDTNADKPAVLVSRDLRIEVAERLTPTGAVATPLDEDDVRNAAKALKAADVQAIAICFLYGFVDPRHEILAKRIITEICPDAFISTSHEVAPEFREFERLSTTVVNGYLGPTMRDYIVRLQDRLCELGIFSTPKITQSNGGVIGFDTAARMPARTLLSGPSTGVVAAQVIGQAAGFNNLITFDVGGTSSDVALLQNGVCGISLDVSVHGYPIKAPMLDIHTVGAGGGSIAYVDSGGLLKVGPRSAGADPGPVCYGRGNDEPTVTDANVVLQTLNPASLLGGRMVVQRQLALTAVEKLAAKIGMDVFETAQGIISVVTANMAKAIRVISVQRGYDPRDYTLFAFGGAGPLHAARLAAELEMPRVIVPRTPGALCALGLLLTDLRADFAISRLLPLVPQALPEIAAGFQRLHDQATEWFEQEGIADDRRVLMLSADMRYAGQNYELGIPIDNDALQQGQIRSLAAAFDAAHQQRFGFIAAADTIQITTLRVEASGIVPKARFDAASPPSTDSQFAPIDARDVYFPEIGGFVSTSVYDRLELPAGAVIRGPAVIEQMDATTLILPDLVATVDRHLNLILETRQ
jgi:N-methylhydantoinase A